MSAPGDVRRLTEGASDDWRTPRWLAEAINDVYGPHIVDLASRDKSEVAHPAWKPNGNVGEVYFCNPPYGRALPKWIDEYVGKFKPIIWLVPASTDTKWWKRLWLWADVVVFFTGRLKFCRPDGTVGKSSTIGSALVITNSYRKGHPIVKLIDSEDYQGLVRFLRWEKSRKWP